MSATFNNNLLKLLFQNIALPGLGDANGVQPSLVAGNVYIRLCTDAVAVDDTTLGPECLYTGYVTGGIAVERADTAFSVANEQAKNIAQLDFGECTALPETVRYAEVWMDNVSTGIAERIRWCQLPSDIVLQVGSVPQIPVDNLIFTVGVIN